MNKLHQPTKSSKDQPPKSPIGGLVLLTNNPLNPPIWGTCLTNLIHIKPPIWGVWGLTNIGWRLKTSQFGGLIVGVGVKGPGDCGWVGGFKSITDPYY